MKLFLSENNFIKVNIEQKNAGMHDYLVRSSSNIKIVFEQIEPDLLSSAVASGFERYRNTRAAQRSTWIAYVCIDDKVAFKCNVQELMGIYETIGNHIAQSGL